MLDKKMLAERLNGKGGFDWKPTPAEREEMQKAGLVVIYGHSDDCCELEGAIYDEVGAYDGTTIHLFRDGLSATETMNCPCNETCPLFLREQARAATVSLVWSNDSGPAWIIETDIPCERFVFSENGAPYSEGVVIDVKDLPER